jgi:hypothetical protein
LPSKSPEAMSVPCIGGLMMGALASRKSEKRGKPRFSPIHPDDRRRQNVEPKVNWMRSS